MSYRLSVDVIGARELADAFRRAPDVTRRELMNAIGKTAFKVEYLSKKFAPIERGVLRGSINTKGPEVNGDNVQAIVGTNIEYARYQEEGTGIYGPKKQPIRVKNGKVMAWKRGGQSFFATEVKGVKPKHYFKKAREEAKPEFVDNMRGAIGRIVTHLARS